MTEKVVNKQLDDMNTFLERKKFILNIDTYPIQAVSLFGYHGGTNTDVVIILRNVETSLT